MAVGSIPPTEPRYKRGFNILYNFSTSLKFWLFNLFLHEGRACDEKTYLGEEVAVGDIEVAAKTVPPLMARELKGGGVKAGPLRKKNFFVD